MRRLKNNRHGFTLLELILALTIVGFIVAFSLGSIRLGITARNVGEERVETYQRLRVIADLVTQKIKSAYPVFVLPPNRLRRGAPDPGEKPSRILAFEGREDSIRLVTFANPLTSGDEAPWAHEVRFYLGEHPRTGETGIILMERDISLDDPPFAATSPLDRNARYYLLARDVAFLKFRYYQWQPNPGEEGENTESSGPVAGGQWVSRVSYETSRENPPGQLLKDQKELPEGPAETRITLPKGVEITLGLVETSSSGAGEEETRTRVSPPLVVSLHSGMKFALTSNPKAPDDETP